MSLESLALVWAHSTADGAGLLAMLAIADHDGDGGAWPSMDTIAARARVTRDAARKIVRRLEAAGEIVTDTNGGGGLRTASHMRTNRYEITLTCPPECDRSARHRIRSTELDPPADGTPQPTGGGPADGRGTPQPTGGANHPINTPSNNSLDRSENSREDEHENSSSSLDPAAAMRHGREAIQQAARERYAAQREESSARAVSPSRGTLPPAGRPPQFDPASVPPRPALQPPEQIAKNDLASTLPCPEGFGTGSGSRHLIPASLTGCARCGAEAADILNRLETP